MRLGSQQNLVNETGLLSSTSTLLLLLLLFVLVEMAQLPPTFATLEAPGDQAAIVVVAIVVAAVVVVGSMASADLASLASSLPPVRFVDRCWYPSASSASSSASVSPGPAAAAAAPAAAAPDEVKVAALTAAGAADDADEEDAGVHSREPRTWRGALAAMCLGLLERGMTGIPWRWTAHRSRTAAGVHPS